MSSSDTTTAPAEDRVVYRDEFRTKMGGLKGPISSETVRVWIKDERIPQPDVHISLRTRGWKASTLRAAGLPF
jgi:hypothetical protein